MSQIGQGSVKGLLIGQRPSHWPSPAPLATLLWQHPASTSGLQSRVSDQQWSPGHRGLGGDAGRKLLGEGMDPGLIFTLCWPGCWGMMTMNVLTSAISSNIQQQHGGPDTRGRVCGLWHVTASARRVTGTGPEQAACVGAWVGWPGPLDQT